MKTRKADDNNSGGGNWSQQQQKALEAALAKYPKGGAGDRWDRIGNAVPGKTKVTTLLLPYLFFTDKNKLLQERDETTFKLKQYNISVS